MDNLLLDTNNSQINPIKNEIQSISETKDFLYNKMLSEEDEDNSSPTLSVYEKSKYPDNQRRLSGRSFDSFRKSQRGSFKSSSMQTGFKNALNQFGRKDSSSNDSQDSKNSSFKF